MVELELQYPQYGFARHKGYGTLAHRKRIAKLGFSPVHRKTFQIKNSGC
jgi:ribonuclease HII